LTSPKFVKEVLDVRIPTFSRQTDTANSAATEQPAANGPATTPVRPRRDDDVTTETNLKSTVAPPPANPPTVVPRRTEAQRAAVVDDTAELRPPADRAPERHESADLRPPKAEPVGPGETAEPVVPVGPKPRSSMLATLGLILGVASALLVLSGPLLGYGIGVAVLALILSLSGIHATGKRHVAGKTDALIGMVLALAAIVVGVLALTGSLSWLGTDMQPVHSFRQWLDAQFVNRF
jgi:hypothetical protein